MTTRAFLSVNLDVPSGITPLPCVPRIFGHRLVFGLMQNMQSEPWPGRQRATGNSGLCALASRALHCGVYPGTMWSPGFTDRTPSPTDSTMAPACGRVQSCSNVESIARQSAQHRLPITCATCLPLSYGELQGFKTCCFSLPAQLVCMKLAFTLHPKLPLDSRLLDCHCPVRPSLFATIWSMPFPLPSSGIHVPDVESLTLSFMIVSSFDAHSLDLLRHTPLKRRLLPTLFGLNAS